MSYIQIEIGGKLRGLKFNQMAIVILTQKIDPVNYVATANYAMVWAGLKGSAYVKGEELDLNFEQVCDLVDTLPQDILKLIDACLAESQKYKELIENIKDKKPETDKKKLPKRARKTLN